MQKEIKGIPYQAIIAKLYQKSASIITFLASLKKKNMVFYRSVLQW
jgi:hypothetical protein